MPSAASLANLKPPWTPEAARIAAAHSHAVQAEKRARHQKPPAGQPPATLPDDDFQARRLERIRAQLKLIDAAIEREASKSQPDGQKLSWLATASARLEVQEQKLSNRPGPGSRRPREDKPIRSDRAGAWLVDAQPVAPACGVSTPIGSVPSQPASPPTPQSAQSTENKPVA